ncbi:hypothetical protein Btru_070244 [Bulinus truncatus]|nr:hypothetical protein Btru_070244 [Bulinus truncatus]
MLKVRGKPKCKPSTDSSSSNRKDFNSSSRDRENLIFNPQGTNSSETKTKVWNSQSSHPSSHLPAPDRPKQPPTVLKTSFFVNTKNTSKKVKLSLPIQETGGPPSPTRMKKPLQFVTSVSDKQETTSKSGPHSSNAIVKRESFRGSEISEPVLVCTTNRNSLVLADGNVDIIGPEAKLVTGHIKGNAVTVKRSQSERPQSRPDVHRPVAVPPPPGSSSLKKSASARSPTKKNPPLTSSNAGSKVNPSGFRSRPVPPIPAEEEDETQPIYTNETSDMSDLLTAIEGVLKDSSTLYGNISASGTVQSPIQETAPPRPPSTAIQPLPSKPVPQSASVASRAASAASRAAEPVTSKTSENIKTDVDVANEKNSINKASISDSSVKCQANVNQKPVEPKPTPKLSLDNKSIPDKSVGNSEKLKGAISDELRNKIVNRPGLSQNTISPSAKVGLHKPLSKTNSSGNQPLTSSTKLDSGQNKVPPAKTGSSSLVNTASANRHSNVTSSSDRSHPKATGNDKLNTETKTNQPTRISDASKLKTDTADNHSKIGGQPDEGRKKVPLRKISDIEKPSPDKSKLPPLKPEGSSTQVTRTQSMATNRPSLPPKPDASPASPASGVQPKRVQSFRI